MSVETYSLVASKALHRAIMSVDWSKGSHCEGIAMVKDRVNNTGPGVKATAGYVLKEAGYGDADDEDIQGLIGACEKPEPLATAA